MRDDDFYDDIDFPHDPDEPMSTMEIWDTFFDDNATIDDPYAKELFAAAMWEGDRDAYIELTEYMWAEYDVDFDIEFDWEAYEAA